MKKGKIKTDFAGLIELLTKNLYPQQDVFIRELTQNGHDAIIRRQTLEPTHAGRIDILTNRDSRTIVFLDNDAGMTEEEITEYLATIGRSGTGDLRKKLKELDRQHAQSLIGQFGIGILAAFVVAERVVVETRSLAGHAGLRWTATGGPEYDLEDIDVKGVGTRVTLHLKSEYLGMTNAESVQRAVRKYADFLPFPIYVNDEGPTNTMQAPWHRHYGSDAERRSAYSIWVQERFPDIALEIIPVELEGPHPVHGVLYISDRHIPDVNMAGMVDIYQARMFIREADRNILPLWAKFVAGVIDSPDFTPTAARDAVQNDKVFEEIRDALGRLIVDTLRAISKEDPSRFRRLAQWHHFHIKGMALRDDDFFNAIEDTVVFEINLPDSGDSSRAFSMVTLPEYIGLQKETDSNGREIIFYIREHGAAPQFYRLCQAKGLLALNAGMVFDEEFLAKYAAKHSDNTTSRTSSASSIWPVST